MAIMYEIWRYIVQTRDYIFRKEIELLSIATDEVEYFRIGYFFFFSFRDLVRVEDFCRILIEFKVGRTFTLSLYVECIVGKKGRLFVWLCFI